MAAGIGSPEDADFTRAFQALSEAERQATLLEDRLTALESRIAAFLEEHDEGAEDSEVQIPAGGDVKPTTGTGPAEDPGKAQAKVNGTLEAKSAVEELKEKDSTDGTATNGTGSSDSPDTRKVSNSETDGSKQ